MASPARDRAELEVRRSIRTELRALVGDEGSGVKKPFGLAVEPIQRRDKREAIEHRNREGQADDGDGESAGDVRTEPADPPDDDEPEGTGEGER